MNVDITQAMQYTAKDNSELSRCFGLIHGEGDSMLNIATSINTLIALAALMKDSDDEFLVLHQLNSYLKNLADALPRTRKLINSTMALCSSYATVNVKGQAMLNVLSELNDHAASLSKIISNSLQGAQD
jgi:hypothetical protein